MSETDRIVKRFEYKIKEEIGTTIITIDLFKSNTITIKHLYRSEDDFRVNKIKLPEKIWFRLFRDLEYLIPEYVRD